MGVLLAAQLGNPQTGPMFGVAAYTDTEYYTAMGVIRLLKFPEQTSLTRQLLHPDVLCYILQFCLSLSEGMIEGCYFCCPMFIKS